MKKRRIGSKTDQMEVRGMENTIFGKVQVWVAVWEGYEI